MISFGLIVLRVIIYDFSTLMIILVIPFTITHPIPHVLLILSQLSPLSYHWSSDKERMNPRLVPDQETD